MGQYDAIVIGAGHNGLTCAAYLAKAGRKVLVLESRGEVGGLAAGEEFHPGYRSAGLHQDTTGVRPAVVEELVPEKMSYGEIQQVLGNLLQDEVPIRNMPAILEALADNVAGKHGGALKAEHGTGRNMAPFVAAEWGDTAWGLMRDIKRLVDPDNLLNPGVLINEDPRAHVTHLKALPRVEPEVNACIECGFCERMCPSRDLTLTPRQRIVVRREMARLRIGTALVMRGERLAGILSMVDVCEILAEELEARFRPSGPSAA